MPKLAEPRCCLPPSPNFLSLSQIQALSCTTCSCACAKPVLCLCVRPPLPQPVAHQRQPKLLTRHLLPRTALLSRQYPLAPPGMLSWTTLAEGCSMKGTVLGQQACKQTRGASTQRTTFTSPLCCWFTYLSTRAATSSERAIDVGWRQTSTAETAMRYQRAGTGITTCSVAELYLSLASHPLLDRCCLQNTC